MSAKKHNVVIKIDWLTATLRPYLDAGTNMARNNQRVAFANDVLDGTGEMVNFVPSGKKRKPYLGHYDLAEKGGGLFVHDALPYMSIEFSGIGCTRLENKKTIGKVLTMIVKNLTRFDLALDFETDVRPQEFLKAGYSKRLKTRRDVISPSGETVYLGSAKSREYCRVYRYEAPHPRSNLMRIELVARAKTAQAMGRVWLEDGPAVCAATMAERYGFKSSLWANADLSYATEVHIEREERTDGKTMRWLMQQVKPALERLDEKEALPVSFWSNFLENIPRLTVYYNDTVIIDDTIEGGHQPRLPGL